MKITLIHSTNMLWKLLFTTFCFLILGNFVVAEEAGDVNRGAQAWANNCSRCHNMRTASEFRDDIWQPVVNHMRIRAGIPGPMARDILAFLKSSNFASGNGETAYVSSGLSGQEIYTATCIACHGADGKGALPGVVDLGERLSEFSDEILIRRITEGYQSPNSTMAMPAKGGNSTLTDTDIQKVLGYIREQYSH